MIDNASDLLQSGKFHTKQTASRGEFLRVAAPSPPDNSQTGSIGTEMDREHEILEYDRVALAKTNDGTDHIWALFFKDRWVDVIPQLDELTGSKLTQYEDGGIEFSAAAAAELLDIDQPPIRYFVEGYKSRNKGVPTRKEENYALFRFIPEDRDDDKNPIQEASDALENDDPDPQGPVKDNVKEYDSITELLEDVEFHTIEQRGGTKGEFVRIRSFVDNDGSQAYDVSYGKELANNHEKLLDVDYVLPSEAEEDGVFLLFFITKELLANNENISKDDVYKVDFESDSPTGGGVGTFNSIDEDLDDLPVRYLTEVSQNEDQDEPLDEDENYILFRFVRKE